MASLLNDIKAQAGWAVKAFGADGYKLDYSFTSLMEVDRFMLANSKNGSPIKGGRLTKNLGPVVFSIGAYIGETLIKLVPGAKWQVDDDDPQGEITAAAIFPDGSQVWPMMKMMKRYQNGPEDSI